VSKYVSKEQKAANAALKEWRQSFHNIIRFRSLLIPLSILNRVYDIPHTDYCFSYRDVCVFGVRIIRYQVQ
jgi:hypothetical protein